MPLPPDAIKICRCYSMASSRGRIIVQVESLVDQGAQSSSSLENKLVRFVWRKADGPAHWTAAAVPLPNFAAAAESEVAGE
jgi:hypothetical protein